MALYKDAWCVLSVIKFAREFAPYVVLSIHPSKAEAQSLVLRMSEDERWFTTARLMKCNRNISDLKEGDIIFGYKLRMVLNYYEALPEESQEQEEE